MSEKKFEFFCLQSIIFIIAHFSSDRFHNWAVLRSSQRPDAVSLLYRYIYHVLCLHHSVPTAVNALRVGCRVISRAVVTRHSGRRSTYVDSNNIIIMLSTRHNSNIMSAGEDDTPTTVDITLYYYYACTMCQYGIVATLLYPL